MNSNYPFRHREHPVYLRSPLARNEEYSRPSADWTPRSREYAPDRNVYYHEEPNPYYNTYAPEYRRDPYYEPNRSPMPGPSYGYTPESEPLYKQLPLNPKDKFARLYKTELCKKWVEKGKCPYRGLCRFAHGYHELKNVTRNPNYKTKLCDKVAMYGFCPYGDRCTFIHSKRPSTNMASLVNAPPFYPSAEIKEKAEAVEQSIKKLENTFAEIKEEVEVEQSSAKDVDSQNYRFIVTRTENEINGDTSRKMTMVPKENQKENEVSMQTKTDATSNKEKPASQKFLCKTADNDSKNTTSIRNVLQGLQNMSVNTSTVS